MKRILALFALGTAAFAQVQNFKPVTEEMLRNPSPNDWLTFSRTMDAQRFSPLNQITKANVKNLSLSWSRGLGIQNSESTPIVHDGVMYLIVPGGNVQALNATNGDLLWEYNRKLPANVTGQARSKTLSIFQDIVSYTAPDGFVVGLDARTGEKRWETNEGPAAATSGTIMANGKVISGRACAQTRESCFIAANDALTGKELWRFYTVPGPGEPGYESWGNPKPETHAKNMASAWGLPGSYDPVRNVIYWGIANPMPNTRADRHDGNPDATSRTSPSDLYSNSTVAINADTGKLVWYYQHLPGDDWDEDYTNERILTRMKFNPDPKYVTWINPNVTRGEERDVSIMIGEGGGIFVNDRATGEFLWATQFPFPTSNFLISNIDGPTGKVSINWDVVLKTPGEQHLICYWNTTSYWPSSYNADKKFLYVPYVDNCLDMTRKGPNNGERRVGKQRPGGKPEEFAGIAKVNMETGEILHFGKGPIPSNGATLATAGDVVFHGDLNRRFRAYDADTGKQLWETILGGPIAVNTITYAVNGKQYVAVTTGDTLMSASLNAAAKAPRQHATIYVFALPQ